MKSTINLKKIQQASRKLSQTSEAERNEFLTHLAKELIRNEQKILAANARDVLRAEAAGLPLPFIERLVLDAEGLEHLLCSPVFHRLHRQFPRLWPLSHRH